MEAELVEGILDRGCRLRVRLPDIDLVLGSDREEHILHGLEVTCKGRIHGDGDGAAKADTFGIEGTPILETDRGIFDDVRDGTSSRAKGSWTNGVSKRGTAVRTKEAHRCWLEVCRIGETISNCG